MTGLILNKGKLSVGNVWIPHDSSTPMKLNDIRISTLGGTICSIWASISLGDVVQTMLTAAIGTLVSFATSRILGHYSKRRHP